MERERIAVLVRTCVLFFALINQLLLAFGFSILPVTEEELRDALTALLTVVTALWAWWKDNHLF